jgi:esterase/lipase
MDEMASKQYPFLPVKLLSRFHFKTNEKISNIISPILIIHSINDEMINFSN